jgi:hypothetical protein
MSQDQTSRPKAIYPWDTHGIPMGYPWDTYGNPRIQLHLHVFFFVFRLCRPKWLLFFVVFRSLAGRETPWPWTKNLVPSPLPRTNRCILSYNWPFSHTFSLSFPMFSPPHPTVSHVFPTAQPTFLGQDVCAPGTALPQSLARLAQALRDQHTGGGSKGCARPNGLLVALVATWYRFMRGKTGLFSTDVIPWFIYSLYMLIYPLVT